MGSNQNKPASGKHIRFVYSQMIKKLHIPDPNTHYRFLQLLGEGCFSQVHKVQLRETGQLRVIKKVQRANNPILDRHLTNEYDILRELDHPNVLKIYEMFEDQSSVYIVTEYLQGQDGLELLRRHKTISEEIACKIVHQILLAIKYCHKKRVMHRDIKLQNIVFDQQRGSVKLIDFGYALKFEKNAPRERRCAGTIQYLAPEMINQYYNHQCDIWSLGILLYALLSGNAPFTGNSDSIIIGKILKQPINLETSAWGQRSKEVKELLRKMLEKNFEKRVTVSEVLADPWMRKFKQKKASRQAIGDCLQNMIRFTKIKTGQLFYGILLMMINVVIDIPMQNALMDVFTAINTSEDGEISEKDTSCALVECLNYSKVKAQEMAQEIVKKVGKSQANLISFTQFLLAGSNLREVLTAQVIDKTFKFIDTDQSGKIEMREFVLRLGDHIQQSEYSQLLREYDKGKPGELREADFRAWMEEMLRKY